MEDLKNEKELTKKSAPDEEELDDPEGYGMYAAIHTEADKDRDVHVFTNLTGVGNIMGAAYIEAAVCQGCGTCVAECPARAIQLMHYTDAQMAAKVTALVDSTAGFVPIKEIAEI